LAASIAERALAKSTVDFSKQGDVAPEVLVPKLGEYLVSKECITAKQLQTALAYKTRRKEQGRSVLLGQALIQLGYIEQRTLDKAITEQIFVLQDALKKSNRGLEQRVKQHTRALQNALNKLQELNRLKTNFISNVSHELRTPLTHIKGYVELLSDASLGPLTRHQTEALQVINKATARLENLIDDLIKFSETSKGEFSLKLSPVALKALANKVIAHVFPKAEERNIFIDLDIPHTLPPVLADDENITSVLLQLADNAIKFTPPGGEIKITARQNGDKVTVAVIDNGIGISEENLRDIFEAFRQIDGSATRRYGGTGLGLALVKRILDAHEAKIEVQSVVGKGSRFAFSLPVVQAKVKPAPAGVTP